MTSVSASVSAVHHLKIISMKILKKVKWEVLNILHSLARQFNFFSLRTHPLVWYFIFLNMASSILIARHQNVRAILVA